MHTFISTLDAQVELSDQEFDLLWKNSKHHYSHDVKSMTDQGGFLYWQRNRRTILAGGTAEDKIAKMAYRDLDICRKALEMDHSKESYELSGRFRKIAIEMGEINRTMNGQLENKEAYELNNLRKEVKWMHKALSQVVQNYNAEDNQNIKSVDIDFDSLAPAIEKIKETYNL